MDKDIILAALNRFHDIVIKDQANAGGAHRTVASDRRLALLAIKKYNKTMEWRTRRFHVDRERKGIPA
jgi:hypothetical protein